MALAQSPGGQAYRASATAQLGAALDKRNALLELLLIADAARRQDFPAMFGHADVLAAAHPALARTALAPLFDQLGDPATLPVAATALASNARWARVFKSRVPRDQAALRNYLVLRRQAAPGERWDSDEALIAALAEHRMYGDAFAIWRSIAGTGQNRLGFVSDDRYPPIGWRPVVRGDRAARLDDKGAMTISVEPGAAGEVARQLLELAPGRYRLETRIVSADSNSPLWIELRCATAKEAPRQPLTSRTEFTVGEAHCPAHWLILGASALESARGIDAKLDGWSLSRLD